jgi:ATP-dependent exoDNAse (exonuclease V) beta subunit
LPHISFSELKNWSFCPFYHKLTYLDKLKGFAGNEYTAFGTAIHTVCENKLLKNSADPYEEFKAEFIEEISKLPEDLELNEKLIVDMGSQAESIIPQIEPALSEYFKDGYTVLDTEESLMEPIGDTEYNFKGFIDAILKTPDGKIHLIDWKSCSWGWDARRRADPLVNYQLTFYKIFYAQKHNLDLKDIETHFALLKRTAKKDNVEIFRVTSAAKKQGNAMTLLNKGLFNIQKKNFIKDKRSCAKCEFHRTKHCP